MELAIGKNMPNVNIPSNGPAVIPDKLLPAWKKDQCLDNDDLIGNCKANIAKSLVDIYLNQTAQFFHHEDKTHANSSYYYDCGFHYTTRAYIGYWFMKTWLDHVFVDDTRHGVQSGRHCAKENKCI